MKKLNFMLSLAAGLAGGIFSHYVWTQPVHADAFPTSVTEVRAQSFVLVDAKGVPQGMFRVDSSAPGSATIQLLNAHGREIWRAGNNGLQLIAGSTNRR
jgi:hypothetical protein